MVNLFQPGAGVDPALVQQAMASKRASAPARSSKQGQGQLDCDAAAVDIVPHNVVGAMRRRQARTSA